MKYLKYMGAFAIFFALNGCSGVNPQTAQVIDSPVEGLEYQCAGLVKYTDSNGIAICEHMPMGFKVGEIIFGLVKKVPADGIIVPQDMVGVSRDNLEDENVKKIVVILQSLDEDQNPENGIKITPEVREKLDIFIDIKTTSLEDIKELIEAQLGEAIFKDEEEAIEHLKKSMKKYNILP
ncbi:MAG: hypothetical protein GXN91_03335 [Epsilonproteobacteria bacterium]|nr:hypothetical protein [Campylobacterota bacterium]